MKGHHSFGLEKSFLQLSDFVFPIVFWEIMFVNEMY